MLHVLFVAWLGVASIGCQLSLGQPLEGSGIEISYIDTEGITEDSGSINILVSLNDLKPQPRCGNQKCLILTYTANSPIDWKFEGVLEYPTGSNATIITSVVSQNGIPMYYSELTLKNLKAEYSGWYSCQKIQADSSLSHVRRYLFIQDGTASLLHGRNSFTITVAEHDSSFTVPCRPDNPQTQITLYHDGNAIAYSSVNQRNQNHQSNEVSFNARTGFTINLKPGQTIPSGGLAYTCSRDQAPDKDLQYTSIRVLPKRSALEVEPSTPFVSAKAGDKLELRCSKPGAVTMIVPHRSLELAKNFSMSIAKVSDETSGFYSCIEVNPSRVTNMSFLEAKILFNWNIVVQPEKVQVSLTQNTKFQTVTCDTNVVSFEPIIRHCPCVTEAQCDGLEALINTTLPDKNCRRLKPDMCFKGVPRSQSECLSKKASCTAPRIITSGFISCSTKSSVGPGPKAIFNCDVKYIKVLQNINDPSLVGKNITKENGHCLSVGGHDEAAGAIWVEGACNIPFFRNGTLVCKAHRRHFVGGVQWAYELPGSKARIPISGISSTPSGPIQFFVQEAETNAELVESFLTLQPAKSMEPFLCKVYCSVRHAADSGSDEVAIAITIKELQQPSFVSSKGSEVSQRISLNSKEQLDCSATSFPKPNITWYKQNETDKTWINLDFAFKNPANLNALMARNIKLVNHNLEFQSFRKEDEGTYRCQVELADPEPGKPSFPISRTFTVTAFDWVNILIIVVVVLIVLAVLTGFLAFFYRQRFRIEQNKVQLLSDREIYEFVNGNENAINPELDIAEQAHLLPYNKTFEFPLSKLRFDKQLGAGAYGTVMKAIAEGICPDEETTIVAVKTVHPNAEILYFKALLTELKIMIHIGKHLNVVSILGAVTETLPLREVYLIVEYCRYGNLQMYLHKNRKTFVNQIRDGKIDQNIGSNKDTGYWNVNPNPNPGDGASKASVDYVNTTASFSSTGDRPMPEDSGSAQPLWRNNVQGDYMDPEISALNTSHLMGWALQIAQGMEHLANRKVIHGDLAARNVLIADKSVIKIADFGLARQVYKDANYIKSKSCPLPVKWMAIESLRALQFSTKSDVWAFGVVLWEMFTLGDNPYPGVSVDDEFLNKLQSGFRMTQPKYSTNEMYDLMLECWREEPDDRPSFENLVQLVSSILKMTSK